MKKFSQLIVLPLFIIIVVGCASPTPTPHNPVENTSSPAPSLTAEPTATPKPSSTPELVDDPTPVSNFTTGQHPFTSQKADRGYLLFLPAEYGKDPGQKWPFIVFLHGSGTRSRNLDMIKFEALPQNLEFTPDFPFIVLSPQLTGETDDMYWSEVKVEESVFTLIDEIKSTYAVDPQKIYLTGVSLGGNGTWEYGLRHPNTFAALVPVMGYVGDAVSYRAPGNICDLKDVPIWAFHGAKDLIVPLEAEEVLVNALKDCAGNVQFTVIPDGDHDISGIVYQNPDLYSWLMSQTLK